jgi:hypothetical protein
MNGLLAARSHDHLAPSLVDIAGRSRELTMLEGTVDDQRADQTVMALSVPTATANPPTRPSGPKAATPLPRSHRPRLRVVAVAGKHPAEFHGLIGWNETRTALCFCSVFVRGVYVCAAVVVFGSGDRSFWRMRQLM